MGWRTVPQACRAEQPAPILRAPSKGFEMCTQLPDQDTELPLIPARPCSSRDTPSGGKVGAVDVHTHDKRKPDAKADTTGRGRTAAEVPSATERSSERGSFYAFFSTV